MAAKKHRRKQVRRSKSKKTHEDHYLASVRHQGGISRAGTGVIVSGHLPLTTG
jgi:hypothetical protein